MGRMHCLMEKKISCYKSFDLLWFLLQFQFFCCVKVLSLSLLLYLFLVFCSTFSNPLSLNVFIFLRCDSLWASIPYPQPIFLLCIPHISKVHWLKWMILTVCCNRLAAKGELWYSNVWFSSASKTLIKPFSFVSTSKSVM